MKRIFAFLLTAAMLCGLCACGGSSASVAASENAAESAAAPETSETQAASEAENTETETEPEAAEEPAIDVAGRYIEVTSGIMLGLESDGTASAVIDSGDLRFGYSLDDPQYSYLQYTYEDGVIEINLDALADKQFTVEETDLGVRLVSDNYTFLSEAEYFSFTEMPVSQVSQTVSTDKVEFTLLSTGFTDSIMPTEVLEKDWVASYDDYIYDAPDGMIYLKLHFSLNNLSKNALDPTDCLAISAAYDDGYVFRFFEAANNYLIMKQMDYMITRGNGGSTGAVDSLSSLNSQAYTMYLLCSSAVLDNPDKPLHLLVTLPGENGNQQFVYDVRSGIISDENCVEILTAASAWANSAGASIVFYSDYSAEVNAASGIGTWSYENDRVTVVFPVSNYSATTYLDIIQEDGVYVLINSRELDVRWLAQ